MSERMVLRTSAAGVILSVIATALLIGALAPFKSDIGLLNVGLLFLLLTLILTAFWGRNVGLFAAILTNVSLNFFFIEPYHTFTVQSPRNIVALAVFLTVAVIASTLLASARHSAGEARRRQAEAETVLQLGRIMSSETEPSAALRALCREVLRVLNATGATVLIKSDSVWSVTSTSGSDSAGRNLDGAERLLAEQALRERSISGMGGGSVEKSRPKRLVIPRGREGAFSTRTVAFVPIRLGEEARGVLRVDGPIGESAFREEPAPILMAIAGEAAVTLHRLQLSSEAAHVAALREADELKTALMASISHDLKTPLAVIKAAISSLLDQTIHWTEEDKAAFLQTVDSQADRLNRLISNILDLNRIEAGDLEPERVHVSLTALLNRARAVTAPESKGREIRVESDAALSILADETLILQAVVNLLENANKYSKAGGSICLRAYQRGDLAVIEVADEGPGIAPSDLPHVFDRFYRANERSRRVKGSGLGLTIVKAFVELCDGDVKVESLPSGTTFSILFPAAAPVRVPA